MEQLPRYLVCWEIKGQEHTEGFNLWRDAWLRHRTLSEYGAEDAYPTLRYWHEGTQEYKEANFPPPSIPKIPLFRPVEL
jgi:hypothetical protein